MPTHTEAVDTRGFGGGVTTKYGPPPKPPRSAFICFSDAMRDQITTQGNLSKKQDILNAVALEWRKLSSQQRAEWDEAARNDKVRFVREKAAYKGPSIEPKRRAKKHPLAPKRPMSAFLKFSKARRAEVKCKNPDMGNTDISRLLGEIWRNASPQERAPFIETELVERAAYKEKIQLFREEQAKLEHVHHQQRALVSQQAARKTKPALASFPEDPMEPLGIDEPTQLAYLEGISTAFSFDDVVVDPVNDSHFLDGVSHTPRDRMALRFAAVEQVTPEERSVRPTLQYLSPSPTRNATTYRADSPSGFFYPIDS